MMGVQRTIREVGSPERKSEIPRPRLAALASLRVWCLNRAQPPVLMKPAALLTAFLLVLGAPFARALDIIMSNGTTYHDVEVVTVEADALRFRHSTGTASLIYESLPSELQKKYFDPAKIAALRTQQAEARKAAAEAARQQRELDIQRLAQVKATQSALQLKEFQEKEKVREAAARAAQEKANAKAEAEASARLRMRAGMTLLFVVAFLIYFLPSIVAFRRKKTNTAAILCLNIFLGWTLVGWVVSLTWALTVDAAQLLAEKDRVDGARHRQLLQHNTALTAALIASQQPPPQPKVISAAPVPKVIRGPQARPPGAPPTT